MNSISRKPKEASQQVKNYFDNVLIENREENIKKKVTQNCLQRILYPL